MIDEALNESVQDMAKVLKSFQNLAPLEQERILGLMQGMAIMRSLQDTRQNGGNQNGP